MNISTAVLFRTLRNLMYLVSLPFMFICTNAHALEPITPNDICPPNVINTGECADDSSAADSGLLHPTEKTFFDMPEGRQEPPAEEEAAKTIQNSAISDQKKELRKITVYFFWGRGCPHCSDEKPFLEEIKKKYPALEIKDYEVWYNKDNATLLSRMAKAYGIKATGVPLTFIGENAFAGFSKQSQADMEESLRKCSIGKCIAPIDKINKIASVETKSALESSVTPGKTPLSKDKGGIKVAEKESSESGKGGETVTIPVIGKINSSAVSLPFITLAIAGLDSFNPCAFFVLFSLLGLLVHAQSRKRMFLIGAVFVFFSGFIYFLFMSAWLNLFLVMGQVALITRIAGVVSVVIAGINIKDFFAFKKGVSLTIPDSAKPKLFDRMRKLMKSTSVVSVLVGTAVLAIAANSYELLCTAGFPMVFTRILTLNDLSTFTYYLYLVLYNVVYVVPLAVIVAVFTITLGKKKLTEREGRVLKLVSGTMMLGLGVVLFLDPSLLNNLFISAALVAGALVVSAVVVFTTKNYGLNTAFCGKDNEK